MRVHELYSRLDLLMRRGLDPETEVEVQIFDQGTPDVVESTEARVGVIGERLIVSAALRGDWPK